VQVQVLFPALFPIRRLAPIVGQRRLEDALIDDGSSAPHPVGEETAMTSKAAPDQPLATPHSTAEAALAAQTSAPDSRLGPSELAALGLSAAKLPRHVAVIMDGNGRWAQRQGLPRIEGHRRGVDSVRRVTEHAARLGIEQLTLYCLSSENWKRPRGELDFLMRLLQQYMVEERALIMRQQIRVTVIGRREGIPAEVLRDMDETVALTSANTGMQLCLAINYGARGEMLDAVRGIAALVARGELSPQEITEQTISDSLYTAGMPDPDLLIRTGGEMRVSNYLLWQISYAEIWVTQRCWPEFDEEELNTALRDFAARDRRFGGLND
jgi:undecaprenyl diphosphate synthase